MLTEVSGKAVQFDPEPNSASCASPKFAENHDPVLLSGSFKRPDPPLVISDCASVAYTVVNPTLADLAQSPYNPGLGQGVCDLGQSCGVRESRKAVSLLGEGDASLARL